MRQKKKMSTVQKTYSYITIIYVHNIYFLFQKQKIEETKKKYCQPCKIHMSTKQNHPSCTKNDDNTKKQIVYK